MDSKKCFKCGKVKPLDQFHKHSGMKDGRLNKCGSCVVNDVRLWREKKGKQTDRAERYARELESGTRTRKRSQSEISATTDPDAVKKYQSRLYLQNKDKYKLKAKLYVEKNRVKVNECKKAYRTRRYKEDHAFRLSVIIRARFGLLFRKKHKPASAIKLLGCTIEVAKKHIESQFQPGMTWENRTAETWHIDHIIPFASIDIFDLEALAKVCHYTNLQPLWAKDNLSKGCKL